MCLEYKLSAQWIINEVNYRVLQESTYILYMYSEWSFHGWSKCGRFYVIRPSTLTTSVQHTCTVHSIHVMEAIIKDYYFWSISSLFIKSLLNFPQKGIWCSDCYSGNLCIIINGPICWNKIWFLFTLLFACVLRKTLSVFTVANTFRYFKVL